MNSCRATPPWTGWRTTRRSVLPWGLVDPAPAMRQLSRRGRTALALTRPVSANAAETATCGGSSPERPTTPPSSLRVARSPGVGTVVRVEPDPRATAHLSAFAWRRRLRRQPPHRPGGVARHWPCAGAPPDGTTDRLRMLEAAGRPVRPLIGRSGRIGVRLSAARRWPTKAVACAGHLPSAIALRERRSAVVEHARPSTGQRAHCSCFAALLCES